MNEGSREILTVDEAIEFLATLGLEVDRARMYSLHRQRLLRPGVETVLLGRQVRFRRQPLREWLERGGAGLPARETAAA